MALPRLLSVLCAIWLVLLWWGCGAALLRLLRIDAWKSGSAALARVGLGFCLCGCGVMILCALKALSAASVIALVAALSIIAAPFVAREWPLMRTMASAAIGIFRRAPRTQQALLLLLLAGYCGRGLLPPAGFDELMYHLSTIKLYLGHGGFFDIFFNAQSDYPMLTEMNFLIGLSLGNDILCTTIGLLLGLMLCAAIAIASKRFAADGSLAVPALLVFLTFTNTIANVPGCDVDIPQALWTLLSVLSLEEALERSDRRLLCIAGALAGMAAASKAFGVFALPILLARYAWERRNCLMTRSSAGDLLLIMLPVIVLVAPWYIKSLVYQQSALWTAHASAHTSAAAPAVYSVMGMQTHSRVVFWLVNTLGRLAAAPWTFSVFPGQHRMDAFGPLPLIAASLLLLTGASKAPRFLLWAAAVYLSEILLLEMVFARNGTSIRYSTFVLAVAAPLIMWVWANLGAYPRIRRMFGAMIAVMVVLGALIFFKRYHREWTALALNSSRDAYYASVLPEYPVVREINRLHDGKAVMPIYNYDDYLIDVPYITAYRTYADGRDMKADCAARNIGYIFANNRLDTTENSAAYPEYPEKRIVFSANGYYLYRLDFPGGPR